MRLKSFYILIIAICTHVGCKAQTCIIDVSSTLHGDAGIVYTLEAHSDYIYAKQVDIVLQRNGFIPVEQTGQPIPEISIRVDTELQGPFRKTYTYFAPVFAPRYSCCSCPPSRCTCSDHRNQTSFEIVDSIKRTGSYEAYTRILGLIATDVRTGKNAWKTNATSTGRTGNLEAVFPVLLIACEPYIATNTISTRVLKKLNDPAVLALAAE